MNRRRWAKQSLAQLDRLMTPSPGLAVLLYHRVGGESGSDVDLDTGVFASQLDALRAGHRVVDIEAAIEHLDSQTATGSSVVVTFDDGTADFCDVVVPALVEAGIPATLYTATHFIDTGEPFPWGAPPASWAGLRDAMSTGLVTIGSHTHTHVLADRTDPDVFADELDRSIGLIREHLDVDVRHFAYAKALRGSGRVEAAVRARFRSAAVAGNRVNRPGATDLHRLSRTPIQRSDGMEYFARKAAGGMRVEGAARDLVAKVKYRGART